MRPAISKWSTRRPNALFGYERKEMLKQPIEILVPPRFRHNHPGLRSSFFSDPVSRPMGAGRDLYGLKKRRQRISDRDRAQPDRDRRRADGALGHRRHLLAQEAGRALSAGGGIRAQRDGDDQQARAGSRWSTRRPNGLFGYERKEMLEAADRDARAGSASAPNHPGPARLRSSLARSRAPWAPAAIYTD